MTYLDRIQAERDRYKDQHSAYLSLIFKMQAAFQEIENICEHNVRYFDAGEHGGVPFVEVADIRHAIRSALDG